mmetsp:Transcript_95328/g.199401  ORF Transcript_95328/g.199401 Transcript_95328/m.199401 type:complete len:80 (+) Transcript_95328:227-466(+)
MRIERLLLGTGVPKPRQPAVVLQEVIATQPVPLPLPITSTYTNTNSNTNSDADTHAPLAVPNPGTSAELPDLFGKSMPR